MDLPSKNSTPRERTPVASKSQSLTGGLFPALTAGISFSDPYPISRCCADGCLELAPCRQVAFTEKKIVYLLGYHVSFFDGLIPEGWLLKVAERNWKLNPATAWAYC